MKFEYLSHSEELTPCNAASIAVTDQNVNELIAQEPDERYPGTFFRIPGMPMPGTTWSLSE